MQTEVNEFMAYVKSELSKGIGDWEQRLSTAIVKSTPTDLVRASALSAEWDPTAPLDDRRTMEATLDAAGLTYTLDFYTDAVHGYAPAGERHHRAASEQHWERVHDMFLRRLLRPG